jgi:peroxiredoxin Q/BCP
MNLSVGDKIPRFKAMTAEGPITDRDLRGEAAILYFYPKDSTPGCTTEACDFRDALPRFSRAKAKVYGISRDNLASHEKFARKYELPFPLISDEDGSMCESFGTWVEKSLYGRKYMGVERATFLIDAEGVIQGIWRKVKVSGHVDAVLDAAKKLK